MEKTLNSEKKCWIAAPLVLTEILKKPNERNSHFFLYLNQISFMNHRIKTFIFKCLDFLPSTIGYKIYHILQNFSENKDVNRKIHSTESTFNEFVKICDTLKITINQKSIIEIGSGWLPIFPYFLLYLGKVKKVFSFDLNEHYQKKAISSFNTLFAKNYNVVIDATTDNRFNLPSGIDYFPCQNIINSNITDADIVFSRFVLEHVTPSDIFEMHKKFKSDLKKGTHIVHFISPSDHRAYSDKSLSLQDFLKYSKQEWDSIQTKFDYHNRLRLPQYLDIFKSLDLEVIYLTYDVTKEGTSSYDLFQKLEIHSDYKGFSTEKLTAGSINIVLKI